MLIGIIGESCTGKTTLAQQLKDKLQAEVYTGKDYLRLAKNEAIARDLFVKKLQGAIEGAHVLYIISEKEHLALLPQGAVRILVTADLHFILERFAQRLHGVLPLAVKAMLEKKHGIFDGEQCNYHIHNSEDVAAICQEILLAVNAD